MTLTDTLIEPYDLAQYPGIWEFPPASIDRRHLFWMYDVLMAGGFQHALEIGCLYGASSTAFVEAINLGRLQNATFCDLDIQPSLQSTLATCRVPHRSRVRECRSVDVLSEPESGFDFVFVDGDHSLETVQAEVQLLLKRQPVCVMAHDTSAQISGLPDCDGPPFLKWAFQTTAPYLCLEDNALRPNELTQRGMFLATTSEEVFEHARTSLKRWGA